MFLQQKRELRTFHLSYRDATLLFGGLYECSSIHMTQLTSKAGGPA